MDIFAAQVKVKPDRKYIKFKFGGGQACSNSSKISDSKPGVAELVQRAN